MTWFRSTTNSSNYSPNWNTNTSSSSPFRSATVTANAISVKECVKVLYPKTTHFDRHIETNGATGSSRFSQLLLEHGEQRLQDWAVVAFSLPYEVSSNDNSNRSTISHASTENNVNKIQWAQSPAKPTAASTSSNTSKRKGHNASTIKQKMMDKDLYPTAHMSKIEGRLHLCTGSIVFEPNDGSRGIVRCPFNRMDGPPMEHPNEIGFESMCIMYTCKRHIVMKYHNIIGPYATVTIPCRFQFTFLHSSPSTFIEMCTKIFNITSAASMNGGHKNSRQSTSSSPHMTPDLEVLMKPMLERPFDVRNLVDVREQIITTNLHCSITTPLQSRPGTLFLTNERIYFQPAMGGGNVGGGNTTVDATSSSTTRADSWLQRNVVAYARRYNGLRDSAIELYWSPDTTTSSSTLFTLNRRHDREQIIHSLLSNHSNNLPCLTDRDFVVLIVYEWQKNCISNYEYILALNCAAGRSFHDLSRYPVFPWVIADYESSKLDLARESTFRDLSKPVGALNEDRLQYFQTRLKGMQDMEEAFLYGTHYSAPGYVLYFLIRSMPEHMLCLQNGKFDAPDRIFDSVSQCYNSVLTNHADVKELIPEFYNDGNDFDFLINVKGLQLGATQNGDRVNDVKLPPWAKSARDFVKKNRKALESDICTRMLPRWLDLIFGYKSRGEGAAEANNIFHHNAYLGPIDLAGMQTEEERFQAELQATEFGIVPDKIFQKAHPQKSDAWDDECIVPDLGRSSVKEESGREAWELLDAPTNDHHIIPTTDNGVQHDLLPDTNSSSIIQSWQNGISLKTTEKVRTQVRNAPLRGTGENLRNDAHRENHSLASQELSANAAAMSTLSHDDPTRIQTMVDGPSAASEWDIRIIERKQIHGDTVSGCILFLDEDEKDSHLSILVTTSLDGGLVANKVALDALSTSETTSESSGFISPFTRFSYTNIISRAGQTTQSPFQSKLSDFRTHTARDPLASLVLASDGVGGSVAFAGGHDDVVLAYGIKSACAVASVYSHRDAVTGLDLITRTPFDCESSLWLENSTHILVSGSWDATVKVWSASVAAGETVAIHREPLAELFDADSSVVCVSAQSIPLGGIVIAAGCTDGCFCVWNVHSDGVQVLIHSESARKGSGQCSVVKCASVGGKVHLFAAYSDGKLASYTLVEGSLRRESALSLAVAITSLHHTEGVLLAGCADGGLLLIPLDNKGCFDAKPTLWKSLNNKSTSPGISSISLTYVREQCICCTGGADGSVALFELKRLQRPINM
jgi:factor associated with neutral sphingomyelinase activation